MSKPEEEVQLFTDADVDARVEAELAKRAAASDLDTLVAAAVEKRLATARAATAPTAPAPAPSTSVPGEPDNVLKWDEYRIRQFMAKNGGDGANPMALSSRNRKAAIEFANQVAAAMSGYRLGPTRK